MNKKLHLYKKHLALGNLARFVFWSILSQKNGSFVKLLSFFCVSVSLSRENLRGLRELFLQKNPSPMRNESGPHHLKQKYYVSKMWGHL